MRSPVLRGVAVGLVLLAALAVGSSRAQPYDEADYETVISTILCDCGCHPQSVKDCACGRAAEMRGEIAGLLAGHDGGGPRTADEVIAIYVEKNGEQILVAPKATGFNLVAWLGPFVALALAILGITLLARHWSRRRVVATAPAGAPAIAPDDPYMNRLRRELEERE